MKSLIIGGGKIGYYLLKTLREKDYQVTLIERDKDICMKISEDIDADIICGDGTDIDVLKDAGIEDTDIIAAVTGNDEENLVICQIAKLSFNNNKTIARINNPKNTTMFKALGVDKTVCSTEVIANLIEFEFDSDNYKIVQTFERGSMILVEIIIDEKNLWCNHLVRNMNLPEECVIVSILRDSKVIFPRGDTKIINDDKLLLITNKPTLSEFRNLSKNGGNKHVHI